MNRLTERIVPILIVILAGVLTWVVSGTLQDKITQAGDLAPDFKIVDDKGRTSTRKDFGGKLLVLNFWASWCAPCVEEVPSLEAFSRTLRDKGVVVLGVSVDANEKQYKQFLKRFPVTFPVARDPKADISYSYGTYQLPETYIIDATGKVREKIISARNWVDPEFLARIAAML